MYNYLPKLTKEIKELGSTNTENDLLEFFPKQKKKKKGPFDFRNKF